MANAHVFPGGTLDEEDFHLLDRCRGLTRSSAAARWMPSQRADGASPASDSAQPASDSAQPGSLELAVHVAALRETFEEAGILLADGVDPGELEAARTDLHAGQLDFVALVNDADLQLRVDALQPLSRWTTPAAEPRRYDTRFFLARAPEEQQARHDAIETTLGEWLRPNVALAREAAGAIQLPPPTLHTLTTLTKVASIEEAFAFAASRTPPAVTPAFHQREGAMILALPGDSLHPDAAPAFDGPTRFVLEGRRWVLR